MLPLSTRINTVDEVSMTAIWCGLVERTEGKIAEQIVVRRTMTQDIEGGGGGDREDNDNV